MRDLLAYRYDARKHTIISSNLGDEELALKYGVRIFDRMMETYDRITYKFKGYRKIRYRCAVVWGSFVFLLFLHITTLNPVPSCLYSGVGRAADSACGCGARLLHINICQFMSGNKKVVLPLTL